MPDRAPRRTALVVEDDVSIREHLRLHLDLAGFAIDETDDGRRALERARATRLDLVLLDVTLPGLDGVSVRDLRREPGLGARDPGRQLVGGYTATFQVGVSI